MATERYLVYNPPGGLGFLERDPIVQLLLNETDANARPIDEAGSLADLDPSHSGTGVLTMPTVVDGILGRARQFDGVHSGLASKDTVPGASLLTTDLSIQVVLTWDVAAQLATGHAGNVVSRGLGGSAAEFVCYGLQLDVVDAPSFTGRARWLWQDVAGVLRLQTGGQFTCRPGQYTMLTATRRWISPTQVRIRYYVGEQLLAEVITADSSIGGGTTGTFELGTRMVAGVDAMYLTGAIDELVIVDRELCAQEIETTWLRLSVYQPRGEALYMQMHDRGYPLPNDPGSDVRLEVRMVGHALGSAASRTEDLRANFLPDRAYGENLADWELLTRPLPGALTTEERRARVQARMRQRQGSSIQGLQLLLAPLLGGADPALLQFLAFSAMLRDEFASLVPVRWDITPPASASIVAGNLRFAPAAGTYTAGPAGFGNLWRTVVTPVSQPNATGIAGQEHIIAKMAMTTPQSNAEVGILFADRAHERYLLMGLRDTGGVFTVITQVFDNWTSGGVVVLATLGGNPAALWLHLHQLADATWVAEWSTTSEHTGYTASAPFAAFGTGPNYWAGVYFRTIGAIAGAAVADVDMFSLYMPNGSRAFNAYVLLDRILGFTPDVAAARQAVATIKHAFVHGTFITAGSMLYDDPDSGCDLAPLGGY
jgi:hypothetical protein